MKKSIYVFIVVAIATAMVPEQALAQTKFIGAGAGFMSRTMLIDNSKLTGLNTNISFSKFSSVRRGYIASIQPFLPKKYTESDPFSDETRTTKTNGFGVGIGVFGLLGTDYQSKFQIGLFNNFNLQFYPGSTVYAAIDLGILARYRLTKKMQLQADFSPIGAGVGAGVSLGFIAGATFLYGI